MRRRPAGPRGSTLPAGPRPSALAACAPPLPPCLGAPAFFCGWPSVCLAPAGRPFFICRGGLPLVGLRRVVRRGPAGRRGPTGPALLAAASDCCAPPLCARRFASFSPVRDVRACVGRRYPPLNRSCAGGVAALCRGSRRGMGRDPLALLLAAPSSGRSALPVALGLALRACCCSPSAGRAGRWCGAPPAPGARALPCCAPSAASPRPLPPPARALSDSIDKHSTPCQEHCTRRRSSPRVLGPCVGGDDGAGRRRGAMGDHH